MFTPVTPTHIFTPALLLQDLLTADIITYMYVGGTVLVGVCAAFVSR